MNAYLIVRIKINDRETYSEYVARAPAIAKRFGGEYLVRGGPSQCLEGPGFDGRLVVMKFPSVERAKAFYDSPEYQEVRAIRIPVSEAELMLVEGVA
jgi:uncharacterized protein (DUF1330 family)